MRFEAGSLFAGYTIVSRLGRGGMATVYLVREPGINRLVALKVLPENLVDDAQFAARFEQEAQVIGNLDHPNIIPLYRYGITDDVPWMALRYVDGGDFAARLISRPLAVPEGIGILKEVAAALDYAHRKGVIHRDLKPQNVLLTGDGAAYLADFGIAKMLEGSSSLKTSTGGILGTPAYMSPEQAQAHQLGPYTDVYALAVMSYQWLTGSLPFDADTPHAILIKQIMEPIPPEGLRMLSRHVAAVLERGLAKKPEQRIQAAGALIAELEQALYAPVTRLNATAVTPPSTATQSPPPASRERPVDAFSTPSDRLRPVAAPRTGATGRWKSIALVGLAIVLGIGGYAYWRQLTPRRSDATVPIVSNTKTQPPPAVPAASATVVAEPRVEADKPVPPVALLNSPPAVQPHVAEQPLMGTLLVETNADCKLTVDGVAKGTLRGESARQVELKPGEHRIQCASTALTTISVGQTKVVTTGQQAVVAFDLQAKLTEASKAEDEKKAEQAKLADEQRTRDEAKQAEATRVAEEQRKAQEAQLAEAQRKAEETRDAEEQRKFQEAARNGGFADLGNGVLKNVRTGLEWTQSDNGRDINWNDARNYCASKGGAWRLPTVAELAAIYDKSSAVTRCGGVTCSVSPLFRLSSNWSWSRTQNGSSKVLYVDLNDGNRHFSNVGNPFNSRALCVRRP